MRKFLIFIFLFSFLNVFAQEDFKILSSSRNSLTVEYIPQFLDLKEYSINSSEYYNVELNNGMEFSKTEVGLPAIPVRIFPVGVPNETGNTISIISSEYKVLSGKVKPKPNVKKINDLPSYFYEESENYNKYQNPELVSFGDYGLVRDLIVQNINVVPVQFNPIKEEIKIYSKIVFQINFPNSNNYGSITKSELTRNLVINQEIANNWKIEDEILRKTAAQNSVLAEGDWYRFEAPTEGIYRINGEFLANLGVSVGSIDPRTIKIYNNGGYILPWTPSTDRPEDLEENAIQVIGESDGSFDDSDYILFYGRGVDFWEFNDISDKIARNKHFYSKKNYYWLTYGGDSGKRMKKQQNITATAGIVQTTTKAYRFQDNDNQNLIGSGLLYVDDDYSSTNQSNTYIHMLDGLENGSTVNYTFQFVNGSTRQNLLTITENNSNIFSRYLTGSSTWYQDYRYGALANFSMNYTGTIPDDRSVLRFTFSPSSISDVGHLDYIEIEYVQDMTELLSEIPLIFFSENYQGVIEYSGSPFSDSNFNIYNITDNKNVESVEFEVLGGGFQFKSNEVSNQNSKYIAIHNEDIMVPSNAEKVDNSNIRGFSPGAQYIIISHPNFSEQAERLLNYRENTAQYKTTGFIAYTDEIYNEFSCGSLDPTAIRDFLKYAYENWEIKPEYVLLFGDGDYDYFNVLEKNVNFIPTFQTTESLFEIDSYPYDDYYSRISGNDKLADLGIGRLSVTTVDEAEIVVDKIINYETNLDKGLWRNKITLLADDGLAGYENGVVTDDGSTHTRQSEQLSDDNIPNNFDRLKIYLSNYQTTNTGLGRRKPDCNTAIIEAINNGTLIFNYVGHGNPDVWAHEIVFDRSVSIPQLRNEELFFLTAATCDFGKYDDPSLQSATEEMILMEGAGMIGGLSAVRPVFSGQNDALNKTFYTHLLGDVDSLGLPIPIGKAFNYLKQSRTGDNDEKFHLFGDPILRLNIPKLPVEITSINNIELPDTINIKALGEVTVKGKVLDLENNTSNQVGEAIISIFDSERTIYLDDINYNMTDQGGVLFRGRVSVENGEFATSFTVPKDISYENKNGKVVAYFFNDSFDGIGFTDNIVVGGTDSSNINDNTGPEIEILFDDESSYLVNPNFALRVKLYDETGLNTTGTGIGHKLEAILNDDEQNSIDLTNYFVGDLNSGGKSGEVKYNFSALDAGEYTIKINAWDVYNNFSSKVNYFTVVSEDDLVVREVYNYPNPFSSNTYFTFQHNLTDPLNVKIKVYTIAGRVIKEIESFNIEDKFVKIEWNGKDDDNNSIGNGTYLYKLIIQTVDGEYKENILGKMAVIR